MQHVPWWVMDVKAALVVTLLKFDEDIARSSNPSSLGADMPEIPHELELGQHNNNRLYLLEFKVTGVGHPPLLVLA